jgi:hypothetical protein
MGARKHTSRERALLMPARPDSGGKKILPGLLVLAGAVGIGYGVFCLVDLVQNCALFGSEVARLIP